MSGRIILPGKPIIIDIENISMNDSSSAEKEKPFRLVKFFTFASLGVIFIGTMVLALLNTHWARTMQIKKSEDYALLLVENLNHQVFMQFIIPVALKFGKIQLRNPEQFERMDKIVRSTLHSFNVEMVNIYDMNHIISYSFDTEKVGRKNIGGTGYEKAVEGRPFSKLIQRGNFWQLFFGFPERSRIITFAPLRAEKPLSRISGPVLGVVEITQDLSDDYKTIFRFQIRVILTCTGVMGFLLLALIYVVKKGEGIIHQRNLERIRLKEQLEQARRLSAIGEMVAGISHEIRNPLGIIRSSAELLKKKMAHSEPENTIPDIIVEESTRLNHIITDFLDFARPKSPNLVPCRVEKILGKNLDFLAPQIKDQGYEIHTRNREPLPEIMADADMLYQAFLNIFINAMQAMPAGGRIDVVMEAGNKDLAISFNDRGSGIAQEIADKLWDPFFTTKDSGTGLGLGIVKNIIESHRGAVEIINRIGGGARVSVRLPVEKEEQSQGA